MRHTSADQLDLNQQQMKQLREKLTGLQGGRVLDFGAGDGRSVRLLSENLASFESITGVDVKNPADCIEQDLLDREGLIWRQIEDGPLQFPDESFDLVSISCTLHHLKREKIEETLQDLKRVLKKGGLFILSEMFQDDQSPQQLNQVAFHHLIGEFDRFNGIDHYPTFFRRELLELIKGLELHKVEIVDCLDEWKNPKTPEDFAKIGRRLAEELVRIEDQDAHERFRLKAEQIQQKIRETGFIHATRLTMIGTK